MTGLLCAWRTPVHIFSTHLELAALCGHEEVFYGSEGGCK